jgi:hypothetical protein
MEPNSLIVHLLTLWQSWAKLETISKLFPGFCSLRERMAVHPKRQLATRSIANHRAVKRMGERWLSPEGEWCCRRKSCATYRDLQLS